MYIFTSRRSLVGCTKELSAIRNLKVADVGFGSSRRHRSVLVMTFRRDRPSNKTSRILCLPSFVEIISMCQSTATNECTATVALSSTNTNEVAF